MKAAGFLPEDDCAEPDDILSTSATTGTESESLSLRFTPVDDCTIEQLKTLNRVIFPVKYQVRSLFISPASSPIAMLQLKAQGANAP